MPTFAHSDDELLQRNIENWRMTATNEVDNIGGWRDADPSDRLHRYWSGGYAIPPRRPELPKDFYGKTTFLVGRITALYPKLDPTPLQDIYEAIAAWYEDGDARRIPLQPVLFATVERANTTLQAIEHDLQERLICEDARELIRRLLKASKPQRLADDELARLRTYLEDPERLSELQRNPSEGPRQRKLKDVLDYNQELRRPAARKPDPDNVEAIMETLRRTITTTPGGKAMKAADLIKKAGVARQTGLKALRELQRLGEYEGFTKSKASRYRS